MRWRKALVAVPALILLQLAVAFGLGHGQGWPHSTGSAALAAFLLALQIALVYAVVDLFAGFGAALAAGLLLAVVPVVLEKRYFIFGGGGIDYKVVYRHDVLPSEFGLAARAQLVASCLLLASAWLSLARTRLPLWWTAALGGGAAAAAALVAPHTWLALAAPPLAALIARRPASAAAAGLAAGAGLLALALFRDVPHVPFGWHSMGLTLGGIREFTWSRRLIEYLPLAGLIGLARRSAPAAGFFGVLLLALVILPLARTHDVTAYFLSIVPGLPTYMILTASIGFLWPRARAGVHAPIAT
jgi:hypothetical protein